MHSLIRRNLIAHQSGQHCHDFSQILIGWKGRMACELLHAGGDYLTQGSFAVVPGQESHLFHGLSDDCELLVLDIPNADPLVSAIEQSSDISLYQDWLQTPRFAQITTETAPLLEFASTRLQQRSDKVSAALSCQLLPLLLLQLRMPGEVSEQDILTSSGSGKSRIDEWQLNRLIDRHLSEPLDNQQLADHFYLSQSHFYTLFNRQFAMAPQQYVAQRRINKARELLQTTPLSQLAIAEELGFADASSLSRAYKKHFGHTPGQARKRAH